MSWENTSEPAEPPIPEVAWDIRREGRAWGADEAQARFALTPEKFEMWKGKLFWSDADRVTFAEPMVHSPSVMRRNRGCSRSGAQTGSRRSSGAESGFPPGSANRDSS